MTYGPNPPCNFPLRKIPHLVENSCLWSNSCHIKAQAKKHLSQLSSMLQNDAKSFWIQIIFLTQLVSHALLTSSGSTNPWWNHITVYYNLQSKKQCSTLLYGHSTVHGFEACITEGLPLSIIHSICRMKVIASLTLNNFLSIAPKKQK